jgi:aldose sugar dehydrogenase
MLRPLNPHACVLSALLSASCLAQPTAPVSDTWATSCATCHGQRGEGGGAGTRTLLTPELWDPLTGVQTDRRFFDAIKNGVPDQGMEAFGQTMNDARVWGLVVHIRELQQRDRLARGLSPKPVQGLYKSSLLSFRLEPVIEKGLDVPWSVEYVPADAPPGGPPPHALLTTERPGHLRVLSNSTLSQPVSGTPAVRDNGQGGLMDITLHPDYSKNGWVYLAFAHGLRRENRMHGMTKIVRGRIAATDSGYTWSDEQTIFEVRPEHYHPDGGVHFGCKIVFTPPGPDGRRYVFFPLGERGRGDLAQDLRRPNGKVYRLFDNGEVPKDNPFVNTDGAYPAIWSYGHRNPQGLVFDLEGNLWDTEHGPRGGDELNRVTPARNYGWPRVSFGINYNDAPLVTPWPDRPINPDSTDPAGIVMPEFRWLPSIGACGMDCVGGPADGPFAAWRGDLLAGGLSGTNVDRFRVQGGKVVEHEPLLRGIGRVRDILHAPDGHIYVVLNGPDKVVRLVAQPTPAP